MADAQSHIKKITSSHAPFKHIEKGGDIIFAKIGLPHLAEKISFVILIIAVAMLCYYYNEAIKYDVQNAKYIHMMEQRERNATFSPQEQNIRKIAKDVIRERTLYDKLRQPKTTQISTAALEGMFLGFMAGMMTGNVNSIVISSVTWFFVQAIAKGVKTNFDYSDFMETGKEELTMLEIAQKRQDKIAAFTVSRK